MGTVCLIAVVLIAVGALVLTGLGFRSAPPHEQFKADRTGASRHFSAPPESVQRAYRQAAGATPGMKVLPAPTGELYLDARPTARIIAGDFGTVLRFAFVPEGAGTLVTLQAQAKTMGPTGASTLLELERAVRMRAKSFGIAEVTAA